MTQLLVLILISLFGLSRIWAADFFMDVTSQTGIASSIINQCNGDLQWVDYNNDGLLDFSIMAANNGANPIFKLYKQGINGTFQDMTNNITFPYTLPSSGFAGSISWTDFNGDGLKDFLMMGHNGYAVVSLYQQISLGVFQDILNSPLFQHGSPIPSYAGDIEWFDYGNDGLLDFIIMGNLAVGSNYPYTAFFQQISENVFVDRTKQVFSLNIPVGLMFGEIGVADYNKDNYVDLFISGFTGSGGFAKLYKGWNNGSFIDVTNSGTFLPVAPPTIYDSRVSWIDYNKDNLTDLFITGYTVIAGNKLYVQNNNNTFTDRTLELFGFSFPLYDFYWGNHIWFDYNNDGYLDLFISGNFPVYGATSMLYQQIPTNVTNTFVNVTGSAFPGSIAKFGSDIGGLDYGDYNQDGRMDIIMIDSNGFRLYDQNISGTYIYSASNLYFPDGIPSPLSWSSIKWIDLNNDSKLDFIMSGFSGAAYTFVYMQNKSSTFTRANGDMLGEIFPNGSPIGNYWSNIKSIDYNKDGNQDLIITGIDITGFIQFYLYSQDIPGKFYDKNIPTAFPQGRVRPGRNGRVAWNDYDQDGFQDFVITNQINDYGVLKLYKQIANGTFYDYTNSESFPAGTPLGLQGSFLNWTDYNGDGRADFLYAGSDGALQRSYIYSQANPGAFSDVDNTVTFPRGLLPGFTWGNSAWKDYNLDGKIDFIITGEVKGDTSLLLYQQTSPGVYKNVTDLNTFPQGLVKGIRYGDIQWIHLNDDPLPDFIFAGQNIAGQNVIGMYVQSSLGVFTNATSIYYFPQGIIPAMVYSSIRVADFNNDGREDFFIMGLPLSGSVGRFYVNGCPSNQYLNVTSCITCIGVASKDSRYCNPCTGGQYNSSSGCTFCTAPLTPSPDGSSCVNCGVYEKFNPTTHLCDTCPSGTFGSSDHLSCSPCPSNQFYNTSYASQSCQNCSIGTGQSSNFTACVPCSAGKYYDNTTKLCTDCPDQQHQLDVFTCEFCAEGLVISIDFKCVPCSSGTVYDSSTHSCIASASSSSSVLDAGAIAGAVVGSVLGVGLIGFCCLCLLFLVMLIVIVLLVIALVLILVILIAFTGISGLGIVGGGGVLLLRRGKNKIKIEDLTFDQELGSGAFGKVYRGTYHGQIVAIKKINVMLDHQAQEDFARESVILAGLSHPYVIGYIGSVVNDDAAYLVMEYAESGSLDSYMRRNRLSFGTKCQIGYQIIQALEYIHSMGVIHRDLSCRNVLITASGQARLTDFGLSRLLSNPDQQGEQTKTNIGPIRWLPVEFIVGKRYSKAGDVYMFGMFLYELLTERVPYAEVSNLMDVIPMIRAGTRPMLNPDWPYDIKDLLFECWNDQEEARPSPSHIASVLKQHIHDMDDQTDTGGAEYIPADSV